MTQVYLDSTILVSNSKQLYYVLYILTLSVLGCLMSANSSEKTNTKQVESDVVQAVSQAKSSTPAEAFAFYTKVSYMQTIAMQKDIINGLQKDKRRSFILNVVLVVICSVLALWPAADPKYFSIDTEGNFVEITPLDKEIINELGMRLWTEECITDSLELSFLNPVKRLTKILGKCFDAKGRTAYQVWLFTGDNNAPKIQVGRAGEIPSDSEMGIIMRKRQSMSASPKAPSRIRELPPLMDPDTGKAILQWEVTMPVIIRKESGTQGSGTGDIVVKVNLVRTNDKSFPKGVSIASWSVTAGDQL